MSMKENVLSDIISYSYLNVRMRYEQETAFPLK